MSKVVELFEDAVDVVVDALEDLAGAVVDAVQFVWDEAVMPLLEEVFSWFGIEDEYVLNAQRTSIKMLDDSHDNYRDALIRGVLANNRNDASFFANYVYEVSRNKSQIRSQYSYVDRGRHTYGLPGMTISGGNIDQDAVQVALDAEKGGSNVILNTTSYRPSPTLYFKDQLQAAPENYKPYSNTLTYDNQYGESFSDWSLVSAVFDPIDVEYDITIARQAEQAMFWIEGSTNVVEGDDVIYKIRSNRLVPVGKNVTVNIAYSGTAVDGVDFTSVSSIVMAAGTQEVLLTISTIENASVDSARSLTVSIDSVDNTDLAFQLISISPTEDSVTTSIIDDDTLILTMGNIMVDETAGSVTIPVKLESATSAFDVDFNTSNITAIKGVDYENITGTLSFTGAEGEIQNIVIGITADLADDDYEQFLVYLENCTNAAVDISQTSVVTIIDGTFIGYPQNTTVDTLVFARPDYTTERTLIVEYHNSLDSPSEWYYWLYRYSEGAYSGLEETADRIQDLEMLPTVKLRQDKVNVNSDKTSAEYKSTKQLMRFLGFDLDDLITMIEDNPDISFVDDVFLYYGVSPSDNHPSISKLLYLMWEEIAVTKQIYSSSSKYHASYNVGDILDNSVVWTNHTIVDTVEASTNKVGTCSHTISGSNLIITCRVNSTTTRTITVENLNSLSMVSAVIDGQLHKKAVPYNVSEEDFTIPVSWYLFDKLSVKESAQIFPYMLRLDFYAASITEIKWYQTDAFTTILRVIQVVVTIFFWYAGAGTWMDLIVNLITQYAISEVIALGIALIAEITGNADIAIAAGLIAAFMTSSLGGGQLSFTDPVKLLNVSIDFARNIATAYDTLSDSVRDDITNLETEYERRQRELDDANNLLDTGVDPEYIAYINSVDTNSEKAISAQYNFDYIYSYDELIANFCSNKLKVGVT